MSSISGNFGDVCEKCGKATVEFILQSGLLESALICHNCGWIIERVREDWKVSKCYYDKDEITIDKN